MNDKEFSQFLDGNIPKSQNIFKYLMVTRNKLRLHRRIAVSYSGGSDSDIIMDMIELAKPREDCAEIRYAFFNTGLEYEATLRHVSEAEQKYGVSIERIKPRKSIPAACREHGIPFISKDVSEMMCRLQNHGFDWRDVPENATQEKYGRCKSALDWYFSRRPLSSSGKTRYDIARYKLLREFVMANPPGFHISERCCDFAKKNVAVEFDRAFKPDLKITGMRQAEGGRRAGSVRSCFTPAGVNSIANYRPLWFWSDAEKQMYKEWRGIRYSDCYEVWGLSRTGCVGCPCNSKAVQELELVRAFEPNKVKAAYAVFGQSYGYKEAYNRFKQQGGAAA